MPITTFTTTPPTITIPPARLPHSSAAALPAVRPPGGPRADPEPANRLLYQTPSYPLTSRSTACPTQMTQTLSQTSVTPSHCEKEVLGIGATTTPPTL